MGDSATVHLHRCHALHAVQNQGSLSVCQSVCVYVLYMLYKTKVVCLSVCLSVCLCVVLYTLYKTKVVCLSVCLCVCALHPGQNQGNLGVCV